jgi:hypothetical protein
VERKIELLDVDAKSTQFQVEGVQADAAIAKQKARKYKLVSLISTENDYIRSILILIDNKFRKWTHSNRMQKKLNNAQMLS